MEKDEMTAGTVGFKAEVDAVGDVHIRKGANTYTLHADGVKISPFVPACFDKRPQAVETQRVASAD